MTFSIGKTVRESISTAVKNAFDVDVSPDTIRLEHPAREDMGDYASNVAMVLAGRLKKKPMEIAETLAAIVQERVGKTDEIVGFGKMVESVDAAAPGFLNFRLKTEFLVEQAQQIKARQGQVPVDTWLQKKIMVEFAHPNTHKEFHIGHVRNICIGESLVRLFEATGATVFRANYEGDVGLHVAKALWGIYRALGITYHGLGVNEEYVQLLEKKTQAMIPAKKAEFLGQGYALGSKAYEDDESAKKEIIALNKRIFTDPNMTSLWKETRQMSLDYFDRVYKRFGSRFDRLFFESEVAEKGRQLVMTGVEKGIFIKDADGSIYFPGEKYGLNNCVFVTREDYATYEGKDIAVEDLEYQTFPYDLDVHVVANEQINFFQIAFLALEQLFPYQKGRQYHLAYGMVKLKSGKMSSRTGEVITADELIDMAKERIRSMMQGSSSAPHPSPLLPGEGKIDTAEEVIEKISVAAVKYAMLRVNPKQDIAFDLASSVSLEGDSGPYLLYAYARCKSVMRKSVDFAGSLSHKSPRLLRLSREMNDEEFALLRHFYRFPEVMSESAKQMSPNLMSQYLFDLGQRYNVFYNKHPILGNENPTTHFRLFLTETTASLLHRGLFLLGIETVERM